MSEGWTDGKVARLKAMVDDGATAQEIADTLGGVTRPAVIGKCHRLGLQLKTPRGQSSPAAIARGRGRKLVDAGGHAAPTRHKPAAPKAAKPAPVPAPLPIAVEPEVDPTPKRWPKPAGPEAVTIQELKAGRCSMPLWGDEARSGLYCGKPVRREGESWCAACAKLVFERRPIREREMREMQQARMAKQSRAGAFA
ncbi:GcrA family cell cycle regulator [Bosea sp. FBZP-16]|uniref:GcrA family cell cycle regulator n=1 Tax=Bosea sp. FBZP-16 TaxID=2065382 RepID=UPI00131A41FC|nr:GcrA family cell cycle regulator [Bosea sp. FBZP-16]